MTFKLNATGEHIKDLQRKLVAMHYPLPRFGVDGNLGSETVTALEHWWIDMDEEDAEDGVQESEIARVCQEFLKSYDDAHSRTPKYSQMIEVNGNPENIKGMRRWSQIDSIVLHQTACVLSTLERWRTVPIHIGVPRTSGYNGKFLQIHPLTAYLYHANSLNSRSVGIEIEGNFHGIAGKDSTWWAKGGGPHTLEKAQLDAARLSIGWIVSEARAAGGSIKRIHAHRQASANRRSDPGDVIWREVGIWAMDTYQLSDGGSAFKVGDGYRLPDEWTGQARGVTY
jgi:hypothetical protein